MPNHAHALPGLRDNDRLLLLGGSGWFGSALREMLPSDLPLMATASRARGPFVRWDWQQVVDFAPTVVVDFACLTSDHLSRLQEQEYLRINSDLINQFARSAGLESVRAILVASSGAAVQMPQTPYGQVKRAQEKLCTQLMSPTRSAVVARAYSVSGPHVLAPNAYAFSDFILQARQGHVHVSAQRPTWRRYISAGDFLWVTSTLTLGGWSGVVDSGGPLIELGNLAQRVVQVVNPAATITRAALTVPTPSTYASDGTSWMHACELLDYHPWPLSNQIEHTAQGLDARDQGAGASQR
mgnify:FL=1